MDRQFRSQPGRARSPPQRARAETARRKEPNRVPRPFRGTPRRRSARSPAILSEQASPRQHSGAMTGAAGPRTARASESQPRELTTWPATPRTRSTTTAHNACRSPVMTPSKVRLPPKITPGPGEYCGSRAMTCLPPDGRASVASTHHRELARASPRAAVRLARRGPPASNPVTTRHTARIVKEIRSAVFNATAVTVNTVHNHTIGCPSITPSPIGDDVRTGTAESRPPRPGSHRRVPRPPR